ncbi:hypothetical protein [Pseudomonas savastanoi]|uniref:hypothetical protein n=1 Tax=Pseudomonas savastanoi TaxID=29438 RepID=UPI001604A9DF|nr:hypothetical protein [Pseudomonas savastanoi]
MENKSPESEFKDFQIRLPMTRNAKALGKRINSFINTDEAVDKLLKSALATGGD